MNILKKSCLQECAKKWVVITAGTLLFYYYFSTWIVFIDLLIDSLDLLIMYSLNTLLVDLIIRQFTLQSRSSIWNLVFLWALQFTYQFFFNVLGGMGGCEYKAERMEALADLIKSRSPYFDLFLLAELWMQADHQLLEEAAKSVGLHMTGFRQLASG